MIDVYVLLGGFWGPDGWATSSGMVALASRIKNIPNTNVATYTWSNYATVEMRIMASSNIAVIVGYSGGGSRATWIARDVYPHKIKLIITYDPSPKWQMVNLQNNVEKVIAYQNSAPFMLGLGGGILQGISNIQRVPISEQHAIVQFDQSLHAMTLDAISKIH